MKMRELHIWSLVDTDTALNSWPSSGRAEQREQREQLCTRHHTSGGVVVVWHHTSAPHMCTRAEQPIILILCKNCYCNNIIILQFILFIISQLLFTISANKIRELNVAPVSCKRMATLTQCALKANEYVLVNAGKEQTRASSAAQARRQAQEGLERRACDGHAQLCTHCCGPCNVYSCVPHTVLVQDGCASIPRRPMYCTRSS